MRSSRFNKPLLCALFLFIASCSLDPEKRLDSAIESYLDNKTGASQALELELIRYSSVDSIEGKDYRSNGDVLYTVDENDSLIVHPVKLELTMVGGDGIRHLDVRGDFAVATDERRLSFFDAGGGHLADAEIGDEKKPVLNCVIEGDTVIYYRDFNLYRHAIRENEGGLLLEETFPPPYKKYYTVTFYRSGSRLGVASGIAGSYYFSIVNLTDRSVVLKNLQTSSSKLHMAADSIYYITGNSGAWQLTRWTYSDKNKKIVSRFADIIDIELSGKGYIREHAAGLQASAYEKEPVPVPFPYRLSGSYNERILLSHESRYYFIDMEKLLGALEKLQERVPDLFPGSGGKEQPRK